MRWDNLFDDLESQLEQELTAEEIDLQAEEERLRLARLGLRDRLYALHTAARDPGTPAVKLVLRDGSSVAVASTTFGRDWFAGEIVDESGRHRSCIVPIDAVDAVRLDRGQVTATLRSAITETESSLSARLGLAFVLRDLCRRRQPVDVQLTDSRLHGTIDRVGRDHVDLAVHEPGAARRESLVLEYRVIRLSRVVLIRL